LTSIADQRSQAPIYALPRELLPLTGPSREGSLGAAPEVLADRAAARAYRSCLCALGHLKHDHAVPRILAHAGSGQTPHRVPCCVARAESYVRAVAAAPAPTINVHDTIARFDAPTLVTTVQTTAVIENATDELWARLVAGADPQTWDDAATGTDNDFFKKSERLDYVAKGTDARDGWTGRLHEVFEWNWNPDNSASYENILDIDLTIGAREVTMTYALSECIATDLLVVRQPGGLDVDDGHYKLTRSKDGSKIDVSAEKNIRYTEPEIGPDGFVMLMNYLTPALLAIWLDQAIYKTIDDAVQDAIDRPAPRAASAAPRAAVKAAAPARMPTAAKKAAIRPHGRVKHG
jgi:hypothetical protein